MVDPEQFDADPDPTFYIDADPYPASYNDADPDPNFTYLVKHKNTIFLAPSLLFTIKTHKRTVGK